MNGRQLIETLSEMGGKHYRGISANGAMSLRKGIELRIRKGIPRRSED
jgi:hypothetical protein